VGNLICAMKLIKSKSYVEKSHPKGPLEDMGMGTD
jgi:hypothetical protein